ncbi:MAG TPA: MFS transporter [Solirubrobacteraceae bacterium]|jgi:MFS family permease|nr:MFS transporter [Solirubrobacteraceae bacterium]
MLPTSPKLRRILAAYTVNKLGTWFGTVALSLAVYDHTHSAAAVTALFVARYLPALIVPALVARVEVSSRRGALGAMYALEGICAALLAALVWHFLLAPILILVALDGAVELTASSLLRAQAARAGAERSSEQGLYDANAALNVALSASVVIGPTLGAVAVHTLGGPVALLIDAGSFLVCGALLVDLHTHVEERSGGSVRARLAAAWTHVRTAPALRTLLLVQAFALVFFETAAPVEVFYAKGALHAGDVGYGALLTAWGVGQLGGSVVFARGGRRSLGAMLTLGTLAVGLAYVGFAAAPTLALAALAALLGGVGNGMQWASLLGSVQLLTPQRLRGRLMGGVESIGALCPLIGVPLSGAVMALTSPRAAFLIFGSIIAVATVGFARLWATGAMRTSRDCLPDVTRSPARPLAVGPDSDHTLVVVPDMTECR